MCIRDSIFGILAIIGAGITAVYILRLLAKVFFGPLDTRWTNLTDLNRTEFVSSSILVAFLLIVGLYPKPWMDMIDSGLIPILEGVKNLT